MNHFVSGLLRHKTIRPFWQIFLYIVTLPFFFLGYLIPKNPSIWVFANTFGFKDNARYLFEYVQERHPEITPVWIASWGRDRLGTGCSCPRFSLRGLWFQYRAAIAFVSTGQGDLARFTLAGTKVIQLWHGIPIKRILLDSPELFPFANSSGIIRAFSLKIFQKSLRRYAVVIASSEVVQERLSSAFGLQKERIKITGYPRHDIILQSSEHVYKRILYAPTWRSSLKEAHAIIGAICNRKFVKEISTMGYELWISLHPLNRKLEELLDPLSDIVRVINDKDINYELARAEILITDYSSVAVDFSLLNRKIVFFTPDMDKYFHDRGIYEEFEAIILENGVKKSDDILAKIADKNTCSCFSPDIFFRYRDTDARKRIVDMVASNFLPNSAQV